MFSLELDRAFVIERIRGSVVVVVMDKIIEKCLEIVALSEAEVDAHLLLDPASDGLNDGVVGRCARS